MCSIVMVHGLNGNRTTTWTKNGCFWPQDLLPEKIPTGRVLTFGYNADFVGNYSTYGIREHASKLLTSLRDKREEPDVSAPGLDGLTRTKLTQLPTRSWTVL